ncbi:hypothetical protein [Desulfovibrio litoralis]|uniref:Uncharacterized protein n=1 Tax=Desulfovibrio litoralis DSM 11393 TaxID=1121455 RepID=A0A1M7SWP0_9BACT|nr:hypothetical protein [Desulfovibrio litoralis]SHN62798.1 hypothetical protein SAMN02745728_01303 [Desulfovibrio litoralis DSM 11393]
MNTLSFVSIVNLSDTFLNTVVLNAENSGSEGIFMRSFDRMDRSGLNTRVDDFSGRTLSVYNIDGLHSGKSNPSDSLIQGNDDKMIAMYSGSGRVFNLSI